jgi:hypothetical protein
MWICRRQGAKTLAMRSELYTSLNADRAEQ